MQPVLLCVDDENSILKSLQRLFIGRDIRFLTANSGAEALELLKHTQVHVILSDMRMPGMMGSEFLQEAAGVVPDAYRILLTGYADISSTIAAVNRGKIHRYVAKPWDNAELLEVVNEGIAFVTLQHRNRVLQAKVAEQNKRLRDLNQNLEAIVQQRTLQLKKVVQQLRSNMQQLSGHYEAIQKVLYNIIGVHPKLDAGFALSVSELCRELAEMSAIPAPLSEHIVLAGMLSELGLIGVSPDLLGKPFYLLEPVDRAEYLKHPAVAQLILSPATDLEPVAEMIGYQYERFNGTGEQKLAGEAIPVGARLLAVARDYWGCVFGRLHPSRMTHKEAVGYLRRFQGSVYDPEWVERLQSMKTSQFRRADKREPGLQVHQLRAGMILKLNLYNEANILLLPRGFCLTDTVIEKLRTFQSKHNYELRVFVKAAELTDAAAVC